MPDKLAKSSPTPKVKKGKSLAMKLGFKSSKKNGVKEKATKRPGRSKPGFSLYTPESDDNVTAMNNDIDKCANILNQLIATKQDKQKKSSKKSTNKTEVRSDYILIPTGNEEMSLNRESNGVVVKETITDIKTPFNNRLISSTPDPDKIPDDDSSLPLQTIPELDKRMRDSLPASVTQSYARNMMRPIAQAHSSQGQNYVHIHRITDPSVIKHNVVNSNKEMTQNENISANHRPEYFAPPQQRRVQLLKPGKRCYSNDELTYGHRGSETPLDLSNQKLSEAENSISSKPRPLSTDSIMDLRNKNLINFDSEEERQRRQEERRGSNIEDLKCYLERDEEDDIFSPPTVLKAPKQTRKSLNEIYENQSEQSPKRQESFGFRSMDSHHPVQSSPEKGPQVPDFQDNLKHFQKAAQNSMTTLGSMPQSTTQTSPKSSEVQNYPSAVKNKKFINADICVTPMPSPLRMPEPRARAILGRPHHAISPESDQTAHPLSREIVSPQSKTSPNRSSPPQRSSNSPEQSSPPRQFELTGNFSPQFSPPRDVVMQVNFQGEVEWKSRPYKETSPVSKPMITPAKYQRGIEEEDEPYINVVDYPKDEETEEQADVERHPITDLPPQFARLAHLSETPANSPIRFPRPRSYSSSRLSALSQEGNNHPSKKSDHPFLRTILSENETELPQAQNHSYESHPGFENEKYPQQSTSFPSKPVTALPHHLLHGTPMNSPIRPVFNGRADIPPVKGMESKIDNDQAIPTTSDPIGAVKKLRWLLTELLEVCDIDGDPDMCQLAQDLSNTVESIPQLKLTFNIQTEIDLALQPLRSENSQLRRRLRIVNQQLKERERLEKEATTQPGVNFQVLHLQSSHNTLQRQLKEERETRSKLSKQLEELDREKDKLKQERQQLVLALGEKDNDRLKLRQENCQENQKLRQDLALAQTRTEGSGLKLEAADRENHILKISLKQRDSEIERLQEVVQTLKDGVNEVLSCVEKKPINGNYVSHDGGGTNGELQKLLHIVQQDDRPSSPTKSIHSDPGSVTITKPSAIKQLRFTSTDTSPLTQDALAEHDRMLTKIGRSQTAMTNKTTNGYKRLGEKDELKTDRNGNVRDSHMISKEPNDVSRYSVTDYFKKYPSITNNDVKETVNDSNPRLSLNSTSMTEDVYKGGELNISLSSIQEDVQSVMSSISESSSSTAVDDTAFREGIATLDANIAKVQEALQRTKKIFS
ncbi:uncharacterized protein LOC126831557 [Patella vulgata]|uniref:uncharacterized protein LOC126831557 n=1 Tax=Patella vulgata TaxID=6465 RepID=UPI00217F9D70|nr:uncharacterized protein LOC126831557 [Patella vulgata]